MEINYLIREKDGYINATLLCKTGGKEFKNWYRTDIAKKTIISVENHTGIDKQKLIIIRKGGNPKTQGTWMHPLLATIVAQWISVEFSINVSIWIEEWKLSNNNKYIYYNEINNIVPEYNNQREKEIQLRLFKELGGKIEVNTDSGYIDLLTENEIIEIKNGKNWKGAVGQILIYSLEYPEHVKRIHLFDINYDENINKKCMIYDINVTYE